MPIVDRIDALKIPVTFVCTYPSTTTIKSVPSLNLDGDHDWMDPVGGQQSVERLRQAGNGQGRMYIVNNAGHHGLSPSLLMVISKY